MTDYRFCPRCGTPREGDLAFCGHCAFAYESTATEDAQAAPAERVEANAGRDLDQTGDASPAPDATTEDSPGLSRAWRLAGLIVVLIGTAAGIGPAATGGAFSLPNVAVRVVINVGIYLALLAAVYGVLRLTNHLPRSRNGVLAAGVGGTLLAYFAGVALYLVILFISPVWSMSGTGEQTGTLTVDRSGNYELTMQSLYSDPACTIGTVGHIYFGPVAEGNPILSATDDSPGDLVIGSGQAYLSQGEYAWRTTLDLQTCGWKMELHRRGD